MANAPTFMSGLGNFFGDRNQQQQNPQEPVFEDDQEVTPEPGVDDLLGEMFTLPDAEEEEEKTPAGPVLGPDGKPLPTAQQKLAASIQDTISRMTTELPADFDSNNPKHLQDLITKSNQATALATIQMSFQPMQMAMEEMMTNFTRTIESKLNGFGNQQSETAILHGIVPEAADEKLAGMVQTLFKQSKLSKAANGDAKIAAQMVRKGLDAMGIKSTKAPDPMNGSSFKTGAAALDAYTGPLPTRKPAPKPVGQ